MLRQLVTAVALSAMMATSTISLAATPDEVEQAIQKGRDWLLSQQKEDGSWENKPKPENEEPPSPAGGQWGGYTAIATYALLASGESPKNPKVHDAIDFLLKARMRGVYAIGMRSQVWSLLPKDKEIQQAIDRDAESLMKGVLSAQNNLGLYNYLTPAAPGDGRVDHSVSQYGVLGTWALQKTGYGIPAKYWDAVEKTWILHQSPAGGWSYDGTDKDAKPPTLAMTAAGVATLFVTQDYLHGAEGIQPRGNISNPAIDRGLKWMADNFNSVEANWYAWYGVERIGVASGVKYFGAHDWYAKGAELMVRSQGGAGNWGGGWGGDIGGTSFCLVFLSRGRAPVMMSKLQYDVQETKGKKTATVVGTWNQRPRDVANLKQWTAEHIERDLNWQIVNLKVSADELSESPILYIAGSTPLNLADGDKARLKEYIELGGMILCNADGAKPLFVDSFRKLGEELFPGQKFRELPDKHPIYTNQQFKKTNWRSKMPVEALSNGCRELMLIISHSDLAKTWQMNDEKRREAFELPSNIFLYSVDRQNLQYKGQRGVIAARADVAADRNVTVARLQYDGNWNPEPGGWRRIQTWMHNEKKVDVKVVPIKLGDGKLDKSYAAAHLTGTDALKLTQGQRDELKKYVEAGGTLIVDAAGGSAAFTDSMDAELTAIFGPDGEKALKDPLKQDCPLYNALGDAVTNVEWRSYTRMRTGTLPKGPQLRGFDLNGKTRVIWSPEDMTQGLVGQPVDGIYGYSPSTATKLMAGLLMYAGQ